MCHQSVGLTARALEINGIATVVVAWNAGLIRLVSPPRVVITQLARGMAIGRPGDVAQQYRILNEALDLLEQDAPHEPIYLDEGIEAKPGRT